MFWFICFVVFGALGMISIAISIAFSRFDGVKMINLSYDMLTIAMLCFTATFVLGAIYFHENSI